MGEGQGERDCIKIAHTGYAPLTLCHRSSSGLVITPTAIEEEDGDVGLGLVVELVNLSSWMEHDDVRDKHKQQQRPSSSNAQMTSVSRLSGVSMMSTEQHRASCASHNRSSATSQSIPRRVSNGGGGPDSGRSLGEMSLAGKGGLKGYGRSDLSAPESPSLSASPPFSLLATVTVDTRDGSGTVVVEQVGFSGTVVGFWLRRCQCWKAGGM